MSTPLTFSLVDVLAQVPLPPGVANLSGVSSKWVCTMAPHIPRDSEEEEVILKSLDRAAGPVFLCAERAAAAHGKCGPDALAFVRDERWNRFPKPQIAVRSGWGSPGTTLESSEYHKLIAAFDEVFEHKAAVEVPLTAEEKQKESEAHAEENADREAVEEATLRAQALEREGGDILEMQLFHRDDPQSCPQVPPLGNELHWPSFLDGSASVICDVDTTISQRGARRWWRLNDGGELVMQAALPLPTVAAAGPAERAHATTSTSASIHAELYGASARGPATTDRKPVKLLIFGPKGSYDWFVHDDESTVRGRITCLDLFQTPDEALPVDASLLPVLTVAVLEAGGPPLLIPPNLPCMSITLNDSVVVEQRRVSHTLWLDEVSYFLSRTAAWVSPPLVYEFIEKDLQDEQFVTSDLIPALMELFRRHDGRNPYEECIRRRVALSLAAIATNEKHYALSQGARASLRSHLQTDEAIRAVLESTASPYCFLHNGPGALSLQDGSKLYWDVKAWWPRAGCVLRPPLLAGEGRRYSAAVKAGHGCFLPVVYCQFRPIFGTEKTALEDTVAEYFEMKELEKKRKELLAYLRTRKQRKDELLDELF